MFWLWVLLCHFLSEKSVGDIPLLKMMDFNMQYYFFKFIFCCLFWKYKISFLICINYGICFFFFLCYRYNGCLPSGNRGRRRSRFALFKKETPNGVKPDRQYELSAQQKGQQVQQILTLFYSLHTRSSNSLQWCQCLFKKNSWQWRSTLIYYKTQF